jgi:molybdopterin-guanine dinucleotide biosynthesis protein A/predicted GNAT family acetyltransferase
VARERVTGALLVGGASRRFGSPKALAPIGGETLAERAWRVLGESCDERIAIGKRRDALDLPFPVVDDDSDVRAALTGLVAAVRRARHDVIVVLPVDTPLVTADDVVALARACRDAAVAPTGPLPGAYRKRALPVLERALAARRLALRDVVADLDAAVAAIPPERLANVNTPADLEALAEPRIVELAEDRTAALRAFVVESLREFSFEIDSELDPDLADPANAYAAGWIVTNGDDVRGSVVLIDHAPRVLLLRRMYLSPELRGRGFGRALLVRALTWAREHGYERIRLDTTDAMVAARALYESAGFRVVGEGKPRGGQRRIEYELEL